jgi:hypothetical protein
MSVDEEIQGINVTNNTSKDILVSINIWGTVGNSDRFELKGGQTENWIRSDLRGFVMAVKIDSSELSYFVRIKSGVVIDIDKVTINGIVVKPLS